MIGYIEVGLPGPFGERRRGGRTHGPGKCVLRLLYHLKSRDADTSFKLDNSSSPLGVIL
jgi:hypothetical protein